MFILPVYLCVCVRGGGDVGLFKKISVLNNL